MRNIQYKINPDTYSIEVFDLDNPNELNAPFHLQPSWPDNTPWASYEEAETWAKNFVAMMQDRKNGRPGGSPSEPHIAWKPEDDEPRKLPHERDLLADE